MNISTGQTAERTITLTQEQVDSYAELTGDRNPVHFEKSFLCQHRNRNESLLLQHAD